MKNLSEFLFEAQTSNYPEYKCFLYKNGSDSPLTLLYNTFVEKYVAAKTLSYLGMVSKVIRTNATSDDAEKYQRDGIDIIATIGWDNETYNIAVKRLNSANKTVSVDKLKSGCGLYVTDNNHFYVVSYDAIARLKKEGKITSNTLALSTIKSLKDTDYVLEYGNMPDDFKKGIKSCQKIFIDCESSLNQKLKGNAFNDAITKIMDEYGFKKMLNKAFKINPVIEFIDK